MKNPIEIILIVLSLFSFLIDNNVAMFINQHRTWLLDKFFEYVINYVSAALILSVIFVYFVIKKRRHIKPYIAAIISSVVLTVAIKAIIDRSRPFLVLMLDRMQGISYEFASWNQSFPSWHTVSFFLIIPFIEKKYKLFYVVVAVIIGISRIYSGVHYLSDVLFGAFLGYMIGKLCINYIHA